LVIWIAEDDCTELGACRTLAKGFSARSDQVESPGRKELAQVQGLEHDLIAKVVSTFADHALVKIAKT
jgi:hypothetical protein